MKRLLAIALIVLCGFSPLAEATKKNKLLDYQFMETATLEDVKKAIKGGAKVKAEDRDGKTALFYAAKYGHYPDVVKFLVKKGVKVNAKTKGPYTDASTALMEGIANPNPQVIQSLIDSGADVKARDAYGGTPLHYAGITSHKVLPETIIILLEAGAYINAKDGEGKTPLMEAITNPYEPNSDVIVTFIANGADVRARNKEGYTVYGLAGWAGRTFDWENKDEVSKALRMGQQRAKQKLQQLLKKK